MDKIFTSGHNTKSSKLDIRVEYQPTNKGLEITSNLNDSILHEKVRRICQFFGVSTGKFELYNNDAMDFTIYARLETVIKHGHPELSINYTPINNKTISYDSRNCRLQRTRMYVPGNQPEKIINSIKYSPDTIIFDLEDSVPEPEKDFARFLVRNALKELNFRGIRTALRINTGNIGEIDLEQNIHQYVNILVIPKVEDASQIGNIEKKIVDISKTTENINELLISPTLESARGIMNAFEIANSSKRILTLSFGLEDYLLDIGAYRTDDGLESMFARSMVVNAAKAAGMDAIDSIFPDLEDEKSLRQSAQQAKTLGFSGKGCIHPKQIDPIHEEFAPTIKEICDAKEMIRTFDIAQKHGSGVATVSGKMIDIPVFKKAERILEIAILSDLIPKNWEEIE